MGEASNSEEAAKLFKFSVLCESMDRIRCVPKGVGNSKYFKQRAIRSVLAKWKALFREGVVPNFFPIIRLLANNYDTRKYRMKSKRLIMKLCKALLLPDGTKKSLLSLSNKSPAEAIEQISKEIAVRNTAVKTELTIFNLNESLDRVMQADLSEDELRSLLKGCPTVREVFWILQILLRKVENNLGISSSFIINSVHPHATQMRQAGTPLERICELASENKLRDETCLLFRPFEPMLLSRVAHGSGVNVYDKLVEHCGSPFYMQLKFDGEHFLLHRKHGDYRIFSRNQLDHTTKVGRLLNSRIDPCFAPFVEDCIFDGELLLWDIFEGNHVGKGHQASDGRVYDVKNLREDGACIPCMAVFDILFLNGRSLLDVPLNERLELLRSVFVKQDKSAIFIGDFETVHSREEFATFFEKAMLAHEEGVVVKKIDSLYKIGVRSMSNGCFKVKPFHLGSETLDVAIIGVDRAGDGHIQSYTVAVLREGKYSIIGKVGAGLDYSAREHLRQQLEKDHGFLKGDTVPEWIHDDYSSADCATDYVHKNNLQVLEIKAKGIISNRLYAPVIKFFRDDKPVKDIDTYETFQEFDETLRAQSIAAAESTVPTERKRLAVVPEVMEEYKVIKRSRVTNIGSELRPFNFCLLIGTRDASAQKLREIVELFGGMCSANPSLDFFKAYFLAKKTDFVVTGEPQHLKSKSVIKINKYNVISAEWLLKCENASSVLPLEKEYLLHVVDHDLIEKLNAVVMNAGNEEVEGENQVYVESSSKQNVEMFEGEPENEKCSKDWVKTLLSSSLESPDPTDIALLKKKLLKDEKYHQLSGQNFFIHKSVGRTVQKSVGLLLQLCDATIVENMADASYVIADKKSFAVVQEEVTDDALVVDVEWIEKKVF